MLDLPKTPSILTTTVGSYPVPTWLLANPSEEALIDATRVVFATQEQAGIELPTDGELSRFDADHRDTNGMIDSFLSKLDGVRTELGRSHLLEFRKKREMAFRGKPAGYVYAAIAEGSLNLLADCERSARLMRKHFKFTLTSPYMLARTLLDDHYDDFESLLWSLTEILAQQVQGLPCNCVQIDEANIPGNPKDAHLAARCLNRILDAIEQESAVHLCFGNYGGQTIQKGEWKQLLDFINSLHANHIILEMAHRPADDLEVLRSIDPRIALGIGVIDVKVNRVETADEVARRIDRAEKIAGPGRIRFVHPDCGFWMLPRSVADRKIQVLVQGRDRFLSR